MTNGRLREFLVGWACIAAVALAVLVVNALSVAADAPGVLPWEPWVWEATSVAAILLLLWIPWLAFGAAPPLEAWADGWPSRLRFLAIHLPAMLAFAALHFAGMLLLRELAYGALEARSYPFDNLAGRFLYELRKDVLSYAAFIAAFAVSAALLRRPSETPLAKGVATFDIQDGSRTIRADVSEILAVRSAGNYAEFHLADGRRPLMRATLTGLEARLAEAGFVRTHRSWLVNAASVTGLRPDGSGDWTVELGAVEAPLSRRYPAALERLRD